MILAPKAHNHCQGNNGMHLRYIALFVSFLMLAHTSRALLHTNARFSAFKSPRISQYLAGNVPESHVLKHPLLRHKKHWKLARISDEQVPDVCIVDKRSKFSDRKSVV